MQNIAIFETAVKLKEQGLPQPTPEAGQFWYNPDFGLFVVGRMSFVDGKFRSIFYFETGKVYEKEEASFSDCVFAPTACDILRELPEHCLFKDGSTCEGFVCYKIGNFPHGKQCHDNPAEAAALAWLENEAAKDVQRPDDYNEF